MEILTEFFQDLFRIILVSCFHQIPRLPFVYTFIETPHACFKFKKNKLNISGETIYLRANINNIFDNFYFAESKNNYLAGPDDSTYLGVNTRNKVFPGWGRTWNVGFTYRF